MEQRATIFVAGAGTMIGSAIIRELTRRGFSRVSGDATTDELLTKGDAIDDLIARLKPEYVFLTAGKSGGIQANQKYPADFIRDNLLIETHVIHSAHRHGVKKLLYLASSCIYPKSCPQPMRVSSLLTGPLEPTSQSYAIAKLAGIQLCQAYRQQHNSRFISGIPADIFGPGSKFSAEDSHVVPALICRMHDAKERAQEDIEIWGTGKPRREFTFVDDLADACLLVMNQYDGEDPINLGVGEDVSIAEIAEGIREVVGYRGKLRFNTDKPDGMPLKLLDTAPLRQMGWSSKTPLRSALSQTYDGYLQMR